MTKIEEAMVSLCPQEGLMEAVIKYLCPSDLGLKDNCSKQLVGKMCEACWNEEVEE